MQLKDYDFLLTVDKIEEGQNWEDFINPHTETTTEALADENVAGLKEDDIIQLVCALCAVCGH